MTIDVQCKRCGEWFVISGAGWLMHNYCPDCRFELRIESKWILEKCSQDDEDAEKLNGEYYKWREVWSEKSA